MIFSSPAWAAAQTPVAPPVVEQSERSSTGQEHGGALRLVRPGSSVENFNPVAFAQDPQIPLSYLEPLVRPDPVTMEPLPWLAERWSWHDDGLELRLTIRDGIPWHNGETFDAADAVFSYSVYREDEESVVGDFFSLVSAIEAASDKLVVVRFHDRDGNWLFNAATLPIFSRRQYEAYWNQFDSERKSLSQFDWSASTPVGTGPWRVDDWDATSVQFIRNEDYWRLSPKLDTLEVVAENGARKRLEAWESGDSPILWPLTARDLTRVGAGDGTLVPAPAAKVMFAAFNFANPNHPAGSLWTDLRVRRAASMAIDRERYAREVFGGHIQWANAGTVAQPWAHDPSVKSDAFNREAASVLLAEAGWLDYDGDGILEDASGLPVRPVAIIREDSDPALAMVLARVARDFAEVGIGLTIEALPAELFDERWIARRDYDLIAYSYALLPGFTDFDLYGSQWDIRANPAGWNPGGYSNVDADAAIAEFLTAISVERQKSALARLQQVGNEDLFGLWFGFPDDLVLVAEGIEGFEPDISWQTAQTWTLWDASTPS